VPIVVVLLVKMNMVNVQQLKDFRGYFIVLAFVVAAVVTPPDVISQLALALPMCLLYEMGIWGSRWFVKNTAAPAEEDEATT
jgi:sec-independent protein translocase protein TatC